MPITISYGSFAFPAGEPTLSQTREAVYESNGDVSRQRVTVTVEGKYGGSSSAAYEAQMLAMRAALDVVGAGFSASYDGTNSVSHIASGSLCVVGPRCTSLAFPEGAGPELADGGCRTYRASFEWEEEVGTYPRGDLVSFRESLTFSRGDPIRQVVNVMNGTALVFITCGTPALEATQSGEAVGRTSYPTPPEPLWSSALISREPFRRDSPEFVTLTSAGTTATKRMFRVGWSYAFASGADFVGTDPRPTVWGTAA